ncbi:hypothetical protein, partial [Aliivibrio fischeri]|uniref:hypothetical protein n=1 Tax=Aliivibrio fischeri TaxID=668 RepID=UPI001BDE10D4
TVHQKDRGFRSFGLVSVNFSSLLPFGFRIIKFGKLAIISISSGVSAAILRFNCSLVMPHFSLHQCFARSISNPNCG